MLTSEANCENHVIGIGESSANAISVEVTRLDDVLRDRPATFLKIDVEGFETPVIAGAEESLRNPALHSVIMELNGSGTRYGYDEQALIRRMAESGFLPYDYDPFARTLTSVDGGGWTGNALFIRDVERMRSKVALAPAVRVHGVTL